MNMVKLNLIAILKKAFRKDLIVLAVVTLLVILAAFYIFSVTARGLGTDDNAKLNDFYAPLENEFVVSSRAYLNESGYNNPGVSLTHTTDEDLSRVYTLKIHHRRLNGISDEEKNRIISDLAGLGFADERCIIRISIIR